MQTRPKTFQPASNRLTALAAFVLVSGFGALVHGHDREPQPAPAALDDLVSIQVQAPESIANAESI